jgi:hypothetical protein
MAVTIFFLCIQLMTKSIERLHALLPWQFTLVTAAINLDSIYDDLSVDDYHKCCIYNECSIGLHKCTRFVLLLIKVQLMKTIRKQTV